MRLTERRLKKIVKEEIDRVLQEGSFSEVEVALTAPTDVDYELERVERGYTIHEAFQHLKEWAEDNGYSVELTGDGTSVWDYTFSKNGSEQFVTVLHGR